MNYPDMVFALCAIGFEQVGNGLARVVGFRGEGPAFGGEFGIAVGLAEAPAGVPVMWVHQSVARPAVRALVEEFNGDGPFPLLAALGVPDQEISAAKSVVVADVFPRSSHEYALREWLAERGLVIL